MRNTLAKKERLSSGKRIEQLFSTGKTFNVYPLRIFYYFEPSEVPVVQVLFSVPKKKFKKAVHRNRIKRLCREAYRLQKHALLDKIYTYSYSLNVGIIYTGSLPDIPFKDIFASVQLGLDRLIKITGEIPKVPPFECSS